MTGGGRILDCYPLKSRVVLHGLVNAPELNGKVGVVTSAINNGRQSVSIDDDDDEVVEEEEASSSSVSAKLKSSRTSTRTVGLKPSNMKFEGRTIESLSVKELKKILKSKQGDENATALIGIDKTELQAKVQDLVDSPEEIAELLATNVSSSTSSSSAAASAAASNSSNTTTTSAHRQQQHQAAAATDFGNMDPEQLRQQAKMMRSMTPHQIRMTNPQLANMSDSQISMAADQMEMMASNPQMMRMAKEQMSNMSPEEIARIQQGGGGSGNGFPNNTNTMPTTMGGMGTTPNTSTTTDPQQAARMIGEMSPEQLRYQAQMLQTTDPATIRRMNPQMATMTDDQIKAAAAQFEMMASNPEMAKMAMEQMKTMTPDQLEQAKEGMGTMFGGAGGGAGSMDPSELFKNMDKTQLKSMLSMVKNNPESMKQLASSSGISEEQLKQGVEMFANMDDSKLDMALKGIRSVQKMNQLWTTVNTKTGGHLKWILIVTGTMLFGVFVNFVFFRYWGTSTSSVSSSSSTVLPNNLPTATTTTTTFDDTENEFDEF